ncbi:hypothetical protein SAMN05518672_11260 [Chitinophaga sp. CF118]|uniref:hypothetical protein n=1 Tax=Chitinophaga sp. CF118 TaxID=1884367 RepID=UPI0008DF4C60|nr:hypothetical protein [Chitinophaga sp. CF118]SFE92077.1 hypothetical protein SAMN05518672_11260 [Chitinophaga sp. CF118]
MESREALRRRLYEKLYAREYKNRIGFFFPEYVLLSTTAQTKYYAPLLKANTKDPKVFINRTARIVAGIGLLLLASFALTIFIATFDNSVGNYLILLFVLVALCVPLITPSLRPRRIEISRSGLVIDDRSFQWHNILDMYIVARPRGGRRSSSYRYYLALLLDPEEIFIYRLPWFGIYSFRAKLSAYLEHFRSKR